MEIGAFDVRAIDLAQIAGGVSFVGVRISGLMLFAPFTGSDVISAPVKAALTLLLTALIYPVSPVVAIAASAMGWIKIVAGEAVIGIAIGLILQFAFEAAQFAGQLLGIQTGFSLITLLDPQTQADSPSLAVFTQLMALLLFLEMNVHHLVLRGLAASFVELPPGGLGNLGVLTRGVFAAAGGLWLAGLQLAAPVLAVTGLIEISLGFIGKAAPQLPATLAGLPLKSAFGLLVMSLAAGAWPHFFEREFLTGVGEAGRLLHLAR
ncbi:MAG TPA: flagellar biosynthetic protein FliR [Terracidiphilus sp.]|nr:flagellar biosynthetic protein FliR [Terracidiphilus sp.]